MNTKSKQHLEFLSSLTYYDASQFVISSNQSFSKTQNNFGQKKDSQINETEINDIFSMQYMNEFNQIKEFIESEDEPLPLLIKSPKNTGKKTLLCQIINHYQRRQSKTKIFIANFASVNKVYSEILYSIMVKLRITFGINQKVQVNEQKTRRFFKYWLDITSEQIEKDNLGYSKAQKKTLCIIIEGIDQLTNSRGEKVFPQFWLPQHLPKNVRLILSGTEGQMSLEKLQQDSHVKVLRLANKVLSQKMKSKLKPQIRSLLQNRQLSLFEIKAVTWFFTIQEDLKISPTSSFFQIMQAYIIACASSLKENQIKSLILCLCLSKKGLTESELHKIMRLRPQLVTQFLYMFEPIINKYQKYQGYYLITNPDVKDFIQQVYDPSGQKIPKYHQIIGKVIKKGELSIRKLEEEIHHLISAQNYFEIKEVITQIQNFLVLYTPPCKYLLCNTWKMLENHLNSDPVFEYNKAIESFLTHYHPKEEQLFKIIFQLSMFFREYSEFQGAKIPSFRHPLIKGDEEQLQQICVFDELKQQKMTSDLKVSVKKSPDLKATNQFSRTKEMPSQSLSPRKQNKRASISSQLQICSEQREEVSSIHKDHQQSIEQVQCLNLQIKQSRQKFKQYHLQILKPYLKEFYIPIKKLMHNDKFVKSSNSATEQEQDTEQLPAEIPQILNKDLPSHLQKIKSSMILKNLDEYFEENYHRQEISEFYYYKEWMWIQFPWICQSLNYNFSHMIQKYITNPTEYMSMDTQLSLIKDVMKISQISKENKSAIYENKAIQLISINPKKLKKNQRKPIRNTSVIPNPHKENQSKSAINRKSMNSSTQKNKQNLCESMNNSNLAKFQLKLSQVDQQLNSQISKQLSNRIVYDSRVLNRSRSKLHSIVNSNVFNQSPTLFLTEASKQIKQRNGQSMLPKIQYRLSHSKLHSQSRAVKKLHSSKLDQSVIEQDPKRARLLTELNSLINQNTHLKSMIENVQKTALMLDSIDSAPQIQLIAKKRQELASIKQKLEKKQQNQSQLKQKLQTIIKICDNNKSHEKESQILSTFLENLKIMCGIQQKQKQVTMKDFMQFAQKSKEEINALLAKRSCLLSDLKQFGGSTKLLTGRNRQDEDQLMDQTMRNTLANSTIMKKEKKTLLRQKQQKVTISGKHDTTHTKKPLRDRNRSTNHQNTKLQTMNKSTKTQFPAIWQQLSKIFQFDPTNYQQSVQNSHYLTEQFEEKIIKYKQLNLLYEELAYEGEALNERIQNLQEELNTVRQKQDACAAGQKGNRVSECSEVKEKMKHLEDVKRRNALLQQCLKKYAVEA